MKIRTGALLVLSAVALVAGACSAPPAGSSGTALDVTVGNFHSCALTVGGGVKCWGYNEFGQVGDGTTAGRLAPVDVAGLSSGVVAIQSGTSHVCAAPAAGGVKCWGENGDQQLGTGDMVDSSTPVDVVGLAGQTVDLAGGAFHTCALVAGGAVKCWGYNLYGQLGNDSTSSSGVAVDVAGLGAPATAITAGAYHTCAILSTGVVRCWGRNDLGQLGNGNNQNASLPVAVLGIGSGASSLSAYGSHTCAIVTGAAHCWGENSFGQLGDGSTSDSAVPVPVTGLGTGSSSITSGENHTCAVHSSAAVCWGRNANGELGNNSLLDSRIPVTVAGLATVSDVAAGGAHTCAVRADRRVSCWGYGGEGQLGNGTSTSSPIPVSVTAFG